MTNLVPENQQQYGSILTILGENAEQNGKLLNKQITFTHIAFGDANDTYIQPDRKSQALVNELHRIPVNSVDVLQPTPDSVPMLKVEAILPDELNDLVIREFAAVATFNDQEYFHAIGNCARIYVPKPVNNGNVTNPVTLEMIFVITSAEPIIEIDPTVVTASREYVNHNIVKSQEQVANSAIWPPVHLLDAKIGDVIGYPTTSLRIKGSLRSLDKTIPAGSKITTINESGWTVTAGGVQYKLGGGLDASLVKAEGTSVARPLSQRFAEVINVKDFGAIGDWNPNAESGTDDTAAIQAAFDHIGIGTWRDGKSPVVYFPPGSYLVTDTINIRNIGKFNFYIKGAGAEVSSIWGDVGSAKSVFDADVELYTFIDLQLAGNSKESRDDFADTILAAYNSTGAADIDVHFKNCRILAASNAVRAFGRGVTFDGCAVGIIDYLLTIESPDPWVQRGSDHQDNRYTGMRNYAIRNNRFDVVSRIVRVSSHGPAANYVHDILISGNVGTSCDRLMEIDGRVLHSSITGNHFTYSFSGAPITGNGSLSNSTIDGNIFLKSYDVTKVPASNADTMNGIVYLPSGTVSNVAITDNIVAPLRGHVVHAQYIEGLSISSNQMPNAFVYPADNNSYVFYSPNNAKDVVVNGNVMRSQGIPRNNFYFNHAVQKIEDVSIYNNITDIDFVAPRGLHECSLIVGGGGSANYSLRGCYYHTNESYCYATYHVSANSITGAGNLELSLPLPAVPENASLSSFSGTAYISDITGVSLAAGEIVASPVINSGGVMSLQVSGSTGTRKLTDTDLQGDNLYIVCTAKYRFK